jgi:hypothetical protein
MLDTISFTDDPDGEFIQAPNLSENGLTIEEDVESVSGMVDLDRDALDNLFNAASHIIISAEVPQTDSVVKILDHYSLQLDLGISAHGRYVTDLDSLFSSPDSVSFL